MTTYNGRKVEILGLMLDERGDFVAVLKTKGQRLLQAVHPSRVGLDYCTICGATKNIWGLRCSAHRKIA